MPKTKKQRSNWMYILTISIVLILAVLLFVSYFRQPVTRMTRGRALVKNNTLYTQDGSLLRGGVLSVTKTAAADERAWVQSQAAMERMRDTGLNAVRIVWYDAWTSAHGKPDEAWTVDESLPYIDNLVNNAEKAGMYAIINFHDVGHYNKALLTEFWQKVAPRYKDRAHVIYEMVNEPVWGASNYTNEMLQDFTKVYKMMRAAAADTHIIHLSFNSHEEDMLPIVKRYSALASIDWSNSSVGFHPYGGTSSTTITALRKKYPVICTEWWTPGHQYVTRIDGEQYNGQTFERLGISWLNWSINKTDPGDVDQGYREYIDTFLPDARNQGYMWERKSYSLPTNVANNMYAIASNYNPPFAPYRGIDGMLNSSDKRKWESSVQGDKWLMVDLAAKYEIDRWVVYHEGRGSSLNTRDFQLQTRAGGGKWIDVDSVTGNTADMTDRNVKPFKSRYVRLYITKPTSTSDNKARIYEFKVYGIKKGKCSRCTNKAID